MRKRILYAAASILTLALWYIAVADYSVIVTAIVWNQNQAPVVITVNPSDDPRMLKVSKIQRYSIYFNDNEKDTVSYTITSPDWYIYPANGTISSFDSSSWAYINFTYSSPASAPVWNLSSITITLNDWVWWNVITKKLNTYIY